MPNLPAESRFLRKYAPELEWTWQDEYLAMILQAQLNHNIDYFNAHRPKGHKPQNRLSEPIFPDCIKKLRDTPSVNNKEKLSKNEKLASEAREFWG